MTDEYYHHDKITLGEHILEDTIVTYLLSKKHKKNPKYNTNVASKIAMMHDLNMYPLPVRKFVVPAIEEMKLKNPEIIETLNESTKEILTTQEIEA